MQCQQIQVQLHLFMGLEGLKIIIIDEVRVKCERMI